MDYNRKTWLEDLGDDFMTFISRRDFRNARVIEDRLAEAEMFEEALAFTMIRVKAEMLSRTV